MNWVIASLFLAPCAFAGDPEWPGFRGPSSNPSALNSNLPDKWSKTSNIEWTATLPGLGWSSPNRRQQEHLRHNRHHRRQGETAASRHRLFQRLRCRTHEAGPQREGASGPPERARFRIPRRSLPPLLPLFHRSRLRQDQLEARIPCRPPSRGPSPQEQLLLGNPCHRRPAGLRLHRSEEHTSDLQSPCNLVCRLLLEKKQKNKKKKMHTSTQPATETYDHTRTTA